MRLYLSRSDAGQGVSFLTYEIVFIKIRCWTRGQLLDLWDCVFFRLSISRSDAWQWASFLIFEIVFSSVHYELLHHSIVFFSCIQQPSIFIYIVYLSVHLLTPTRTPMDKANKEATRLFRIIPYPMLSLQSSLRYNYCIYTVNLARSTLIIKTLYIECV